MSGISWGSELWDGFEPVSKYVDTGLGFVDGWVANFVKERGAIENEYAKRLRHLVDRYTPKGMSLAAASNQNNKDNSKNKKNTLKKNQKIRSGEMATASGPESISIITQDDEYSHMNAYRTMLIEVGFIAGQHEILAESFSKENYKSVCGEVKKLKERLKSNTKTYHKLNADLKARFQSMSKAKDKFRKAFDEQNKAAEAYDVASRDGATSVNELKKLGMQRSVKASNCESMKAQYADQMLKTNAAQSQHYNSLLPNVLNDLQGLEQSRIQLLCQSVRSMVAKEQEVAAIMGKCHESICQSLEGVDTGQDTSLVVEKFKTGDVPPGDFNFEEIHDPQSLLKQDTLAENKPTSLNLYPRKRELDKQIEATQLELNKAEREAQSLTKMMNLCQDQPKYGKSDKFRDELKVANQRVLDLETVLKNLRAERVAVEGRLEAIKEGGSKAGGGNSPMLSVPNLRRNQETRSSSSQSIKSSTLSVGSSSGASSSGGGGGVVVVEPQSHKAVVTPTLVAAAVAYEHQQPRSAVDFRLSGSSDWGEGEEAAVAAPGVQACSMPVPPPPSYTAAAAHHPVTAAAAAAQQQQAFSPTPSDETSSTSSSSGMTMMKRCEALYDYNESLENNIPMVVGDMFYVIEDDCDGWTRVRRLMPTASGLDEGYVPSSYLKSL